MSQIGTSWVFTSWAIPAWATDAWFGPQLVRVGNPLIPNTVARLGNLFQKTFYNGPPISEPSLAVKKFLDELKVERKNTLTSERRKLATLKTEQKKIIEAPVESRPALELQCPDLDVRIQAQSQVVRDARKLYEEAEKTRAEQSRIDQLAEYALQQWNIEEGRRRIAREEAARIQQLQEAEDEEMAHVLLMVHEL